MKVIKKPIKSNWSALTTRPEIEKAELNQTVTGIISNVKESGDRALFEYSMQFDKAQL